jgi:hypothetical protein
MCIQCTETEKLNKIDFSEIFVLSTTINEYLASYYLFTSLHVLLRVHPAGLGAYHHLGFRLVSGLNEVKWFRGSTETAGP